ncbi:MAG TPA: efflux RND transporter periplasmic adaptor subunit [Gammaproteobacteria bacterium]|nr:efflux RND transporter periplasmic adaptor subunit [Gammaproteobacteria bacterium]
MLSPKSSRQLALLFGLAAIAALLVITRPEQGPELREAVSPRVQVEAVALHDLQPVAVVSGRLDPARKTALHFELSGQVDARPVEPGQTVAQGELLLALDAGDFVDALAEAEAQLEQERRNIERDRALLKLSRRNYALQQSELARLGKLEADSLVSESQLDESRIRLIQLEAEAAQLEASTGSAESRLALREAARNRAARNLERTRLSAPFSGTVNMVAVQLGDYVTPNQTVVELIDSSQLDLYLEVRGDVAHALAQGQAVEVSVNGTRLPGKVIALQVDPDPVTFTHAVRVRLSGERARPGQVAEASLPLQALHQAAAVPSTAVLYDEGRTYLFRVNGDILERVEVVLGPRVGELQVVEQGIGAADRIVARDVAALSDAQKVQPVTADDAPVAVVDR